MKRASVLLLAAGIAAACSDAPAGPAGPASAPAVIMPAGTDGQTAEVGTAVAAAPAVIVKDGRGMPVAGALVQFAVTRGGGTLGASSARTDQAGFASAVEWRLGTDAGVNEATATVGGLEPVRFIATAFAATAPPGVGEFDLQVRFIGSATPRQREAVTKAVTRWRTVIVGKLPSVRITTAAGACFDKQPAINEVVDDLLIFVEFSDIDGPGKTLGEAGPCMIRSDSHLPIVGVLRLDNADLAPMERNGTLDDVVLHEIGHVLGIGTIWANRQLIDGKGGDDPLFTGQHALQSYLGMGVASAAGVPVENTGSTGTRDGHWRESVFGNELMTGYIGSAPNPLSGLTVASLKDLGYNTSMLGASPFTIGSTMQSIVQGVSEPLDLSHHERILEPRFEVDRTGRMTPARSAPPSGGALSPMR